MRCNYCGDESLTEIYPSKFICDSCGGAFTIEGSSPSSQAKNLGCKSLAQVARATKQSEQTLINWYRNKPELFDAVCVGVANNNTRYDVGGDNNGGQP